MDIKIKVGEVEVELTGGSASYLRTIAGAIRQGLDAERRSRGTSINAVADALNKISETKSEG